MKEKRPKEKGRRKNACGKPISNRMVIEHLSHQRQMQPNSQNAFMRALLARGISHTPNLCVD
jgi:hypothetical protein